ncbi:MAG: matrixin family metalloprotease [Myxococcota bacterium]
MKSPFTIGLLLSTLVGGCVFGQNGPELLYQPPVQEERAQLRTLRPPRLRSPGPFAQPTQPVPVWAYADEAHRRQVPGWEKKFRTQLDNVNPLLSDCCGLRLELERAFEWSHEAEDLETALEELVAHSPLEGHRIVVGLLPPLTYDTVSFRTLGLAQVGGRYMVMRGLNDPDIAEAIARFAPNAGAEARRSLYLATLVHKEQVVLLHELGHLMGLEHVPATTAIMHDTYSWSIDGFSSSSLTSMVTARDELTPLGVAEAMARSGGVDAAEALFATALAERPEDPTLLKRRCSALHRGLAESEPEGDGAWRMALDACLAAKAIDPNPWFLMAAAQAAISSSEWSTAHGLADELEVGLNSAEGGADREEAPVVLARLRLQLAEASAARRALATASTTIPSDLEQWLEQVEKTHPEVLEAGYSDEREGALLRRLLVFGEGASTRPSRELLEEAKVISEDFDRTRAPYVVLCRAWLTTGRNPDTVCGRALSAEPKDPALLFAWAQYDLQRRRIDASIRKLREVLRVEPDHREAKRLLAALRSAVGSN